MCACYKTADFFLMDINIIKAVYIFIYLFNACMFLPGSICVTYPHFLGSFSLFFIMIMRIRMKIPTKSTNSSDECTVYLKFAQYFWMYQRYGTFTSSSYSSSTLSRG